MDYSRACPRSSALPPLCCTPRGSRPGKPASPEGPAAPASRSNRFVSPAGGRPAGTRAAPVRTRLRSPCRYRARPHSARPASSSAVSSMTSPPSGNGIQDECPKEPEGTTEAESRAQGNNAGPLRRLQAPDYLRAHGTKPRRRQRTRAAIFTLAGRHRQGTSRDYLCLSRLLEAATRPRAAA